MSVFQFKRHSTLVSRKPLKIDQQLFGKPEAYVVVAGSSRSAKADFIKLACGVQATSSFNQNAPMHSEPMTLEVTPLDLDEHQVSLVSIPDFCESDAKKMDLLLKFFADLDPKPVSFAGVIYLHPISGGSNPSQTDIPDLRSLLQLCGNADLGKLAILAHEPSHYTTSSASVQAEVSTLKASVSSLINEGATFWNQTLTSRVSQVIIQSLLQQLKLRPTKSYTSEVQFEMNNLRTYLVQQMTVIEAMRKEKADSEAKIQELTDKYAALKVDQKRMTGNFEKHLEDAISAKEDADKTLRALQTETDDLNIEHRQLQDRHRQLRKEKDGLQDKLDDLTHENRRSAESVKWYEAQLEEFRGMNVVLLKELMRQKAKEEAEEQFRTSSSAQQDGGAASDSSHSTSSVGTALVVRSRTNSSTPPKDDITATVTRTRSFSVVSDPPEAPTTPVPPPLAEVVLPPLPQPQPATQNNEAAVARPPRARRGGTSNDPPPTPPLKSKDFLNQFFVQLVDEKANAELGRMRRRVKDGKSPISW